MLPKVQAVHIFPTENQHVFLNDRDINKKAKKRTMRGGKMNSMGVFGAKKHKAIGGKYLKKRLNKIGSKRKTSLSFVPRLNFNKYIKTSVCQLVFF